MNYHICSLNQTHFTQIMDLQKIIAEHLIRPDLLNLNNDDLIYEKLKIPNNVIGAYDGEKLVGYHVMNMVDLTKELINIDVSWLPGTVTKITKFGPTAVHPAHRGKQLIAAMGLVQFDIIRQSDYYHAIATASPYNYPSLKFLFSQGFQLIQIIVAYSGMLRFVLFRNFREGFQKEQHTLRVSHENIDTQQLLLAKHFHGYGICKTDRGHDIIYGYTE
jgi:hypothetical protein